MSEIEQVLQELKDGILKGNHKTAELNKANVYQGGNILRGVLRDFFEDKSGDLPVFSDVPYTIVQSLQELNSLVPKFKKASAVGVYMAAFDNSGKVSSDPFLATPAFLSLSFSETDAVVIDLNKVEFKTLASFFSSKALKIFYNAPDFLLFSKHQNIEVNNISDVRVIDQLLCHGLGNLSPSLSETVVRRLHKDLYLPELNYSMSTVLIEKTLAISSLLVFELAKVLYPLVREEGIMDLVQLENNVCFAIAEMRYNGMPFDHDTFTMLRDAKSLELKNLSDKLQEALSYHIDSPLGLVSKSVDLNSPVQVQKGLKAKGMSLSDTSEETLRPLAEKHKEIELLLEYRSLSSLLSNFSNSYLRHVHPITGSIHANIWQTETATGRLKTSNPNIHGTPNGEIRRVFKAPSGCVFVTGDYKQIEPVIAAVLAKDKVMLDEIDKGIDIYEAAAGLFIGNGDISPDERKKTKPVVLGFLYNMSDQGLVRYSKTFGVSLTLQEATNKRKLFFTKYEGIKKWHEKLEEESKETRSVRSVLNRCRTFDNYILLISKPSDMTKKELNHLVESLLPGTKILKHNSGVVVPVDNEAEAKQIGSILEECGLTSKMFPDKPPLTQVYNGPCQMTSADLIKTAMVDMLPPTNQFKALFVMSTHDDLTYIVPELNCEEFKKVLEKEMQNAAVKLLGVRPKISLKSGPDYYYS